MIRWLTILLLIVGCAFAREYIAIIDFEGIGVTNDEARALTQRLTSEMIKLEVYQILERSEMKRLLEEQKFQYSGCVDLNCAVELGKMLGAKYMVVGSISKVGNTYSIDSRLIDVETSESYASGVYSYRGDIDKLMDSGMKSIAHQLCDEDYDEEVQKESTVSNIKETKVSSNKTKNTKGSFIRSNANFKFLTIKTENRISNIYYKELNDTNRRHLGYALKDISVGVQLKENKNYTIESETDGIRDTINVLMDSEQTIVFKKIK